MKRYSFQHKDLMLSYLDSEGSGPVLIALHAHWMEGVSFIPLAAALSPPWRVIALDQRGHGYSDHAASYTREDYLDDLKALLVHLKLEEPVVLIGNSLGGVNAYQFAARYPKWVRALIIEDIGVEIYDDYSFSLAWAGIFKTREELGERVGPRFLPFLKDSFRHTEKGWQLAFDPHELLNSAEHIKGNHWKAWLASECPALLIRGKDSRVSSQTHFEEMVSRRPNTRLEVLEGGHVVHVDNPPVFSNTVKEFLTKL